MGSDDGTTGGGPPPGLRLRATDREDLKILSAALQDSIVPLADMTFLAEEGRFVMVVNRFRWEAAGDATPAANDADDPEPAFLRTHCGVSVGGVQRVRLRGLDQTRRQALLSLLSLEPAEDGLCLVFSGGGEVRLLLATEAETSLDCRLMDLGESWPTTKRPRHLFEEDGESP